MLEKVTTIVRVQGVLADLDELTDSDKYPANLTEYPAGSTFHAVDTGDVFVRYADGWLLDRRTTSS